MGAKKKNAERLPTVAEMWQLLKKISDEREELNASLIDMRKNIGGIGDTQGEIAEDLFRRNFIPAMKKAGLALDENYIYRLQRKNTGEYDIVGLNGDCAVVAEIKANLKKSDIREFLKKLRLFRAHFPEYRRNKFYGAVAGLSVRKGAEKFAEDNGLFLLTQTAQDGAEVHNAKGFKPRAF